MVVRIFFNFLNALIPFTDPSRAVWRDILHSIVLCTFLYFAPQLQLHDVWQTIIETVTARRPNRNQTTEQIADSVLQGDIRGEVEHQDEPENRPHIPEGPGPAELGEGRLDPETQAHNEQDFQRFLNDNLPRQNDPVNPDTGAGFGIAGPAQQPARHRDPNRPVGAKKAKSLARRDRIRAYNEFLRERGDTQRAQEASTAEQWGKEQAEERARRLKVEAEIEERERKKRENKKEREILARKEEAEKIIHTAKQVSEALDSRGMIEVAKIVEQVDRDSAWVEAIVKKEGILGMKSENGTKTLTMLTGKGWIVRVDENSMKALYQVASSHNGSSSGKIGWSELGCMLEQVLGDHGRVSLSGG